MTCARGRGAQLSGAFGVRAALSRAVVRSRSRRCSLRVPGKSVLAARRRRTGAFVFVVDERARARFSANPPSSSSKKRFYGSNGITASTRFKFRFAIFTQILCVCVCVYSSRQLWWCSNAWWREIKPPVVVAMMPATTTRNVTCRPSSAEAHDEMTSFPSTIRTRNYIIT